MSLHGTNLPPAVDTSPAANAGKRPDICLHLIARPDLEETIIDFLLEHETIVPRFISTAVDTHGAAIALASLAERVRGRAKRVEFRLLLERADVDRLLPALEERLPHAGISWWLVPLLGYGRIE